MGCVLGVAVVLALSACIGKSASSKFYVLSPLTGRDPVGYSGSTIGVLPVIMPDYLDRPQIVTRVSENRVNLDEYNRWAESLKENFTNVLVENLSRLLNLSPEKVVLTSRYPGVPVALQVGVEVVQFDGVLGGDVTLDVKWGLFKPGDKELIAGRKSLYKEPTGAATHEALVAAESRAVEALSRDIAKTIKDRE